MEKQITVLIAEDNTLMRNTLKRLIADAPGIMTLAEASNGQQAISLASELSPDIILMDINMSPVNGFEATRKIVSHNPAARIIGLSLHTEISYIKNLLQLGAKGYLTKKASPAEIINAIKIVAAGGAYIDSSLAGKL